MVITSWPGMQGGYAAPQQYQVAQMTAGRNPMHGGWLGPRYTGPFNFNAGMSGGTGAMMQMAMPMIAQQLMGPGKMPAQFFPEQNFYDQMEANKYYMDSQQAMAIGGNQDIESIENMLGGMQQMMTGKPLSDRSRARNFRIAEGINQYTPLIAQIAGPDLIDRMHGSRGSATVMAQQLHQALRTRIDPITGRVGYSGASAGRVTTELFDELYGEDADVQKMRGMTAGQAGIFANEMQSRGLLGRPAGMLSIQERLQELPDQMSERMINRLARQRPGIRALAGDGKRPSESEMEAARNDVRTTFSQLKRGVNGADEAITSTEDLEGMPGGSEIIRAADAQRIGDKLKNLSGAVKAMRDIFGDMGNPNAPMREIINGLDMLTQGGLATMSPAAMEDMVRKTHVLAKQTGVGMQGMMALMSQAAPLADQLGLDRRFAVTATQHAVGFGAAVADTRGLDIPAWGALTQEQLTMADQQLTMHANASPATNNLSALMRMRDAGMFTARKDSELDMLMQAVERKDTSYTFTDAQGETQTRNVAINRNRLQGLLANVGVTRTDSMSILMDRYGNQEFSDQYGTGQIMRELQGTEMGRQLFAPALGNRFGSRLMESGVDDMLQAGGVVTDTASFRKMMLEVGQGVSDDVRNLTPEEAREAGTRRDALGASFRARLRESIKKRMPGASDAEIDKMTDETVDQMGGEDQLSTVGESIYATVDAIARENPLTKSFVGYVDSHSPEAFEQRRRRDRQADATTMMQSAFSSLGTAGPIQRISDAIQQAGPDTTAAEIMQKALGGVDLAAIAAADPQGAAAEVLGLIEKSRNLDPNDPEQFKQLQQASRGLKALTEGGIFATQELARMEASREEITAAEATDVQKQEAMQKVNDQRTRDRRIQDAGLTNLDTQIAELEGNVTTQATAADPVDRNAAKLAGRSRLRAVLARTGEIDLGGGRFLTATGIQTRDADGRVTSSEGLQSEAVQREAAVALRQYHDQQRAEFMQGAGDLDPAEALKLAEEQGLMLGDSAYGTPEYKEKLKKAEAGETFGTYLRDELGVMVGAKVSDDDIAAIGDAGTNLTKLVDEGGDAADINKATDRYVGGASAQSMALLDDTVRMEQLGRGGLELVQTTLDDARELQGLAAAESKRLGAPVSVADILAGAKGVDAKVTEQARDAKQQLDSNWKEIQTKTSTGRVHKAGSDEEMTDLEREALVDRQKFVRRSGDTDVLAADVADRLIGLGDDAQQDRMGGAGNRAEIVKALTAGGRTRMEIVDRAIRGRAGIEELAVAKGLFGEDVTDASRLTDAQRQQAAEKLRNANLTEDEQGDLARMQRDAAVLDGVGLQGRGADAITDTIIRQLRDMPGMVDTPEGGEEKKMTVTLKGGHLTVHDDDTMSLTAVGEGVMNMVNNAIGLG